MLYSSENTIFLDKIPGGLYPDIPRVLVNPDEKWIKHVHCDGARFHVLTYIGCGFPRVTKVLTPCSEPDCIFNKPEASK